MIANRIILEDVERGCTLGYGPLPLRLSLSEVRLKRLKTTTTSLAAFIMMTGHSF